MRASHKADVDPTLTGASQNVGMSVSEVSMQLLVIPLDHALPALQVYLEAQADDGLALTEEERNDLARLATRAIETSEALVRYAVGIGGRPQRN